MVRALSAALRFLTRLPIPGRETFARELGKATIFFPFVGGLIGLLLAGVNLCAGRLWQNEVISNAIVIVTLVLVTGGLHLDGLMDICDGVFGGRSPGHALEIMKDSRAGAFGVLGAISVLLLKFSFLFALSSDLKWRALIFVPVAGRWALVYAISGFPYLRQEGTGRAFKEQVNGWHLFGASLLAAGIGGLLFRLWFPALAVIVWLAVYLQARYLMKKLGGLTGDAYGAIAEVVEVAVLASIPLLAQIPWAWGTPPA